MEPVSGFVVGIVTNNEDPEAMGRVKVTIPAVYDSEAPFWVLPACWPGGGGGSMTGSQYQPPEVGAQVFVLFEHGVWNKVDTQAIYLTGFYGRKDGASVSPETIQQASSAENARKRTVLWENEKVSVHIIDEDDSKKIVLMAKETGSKIEVNAADNTDGNSETIYIEGRTMISLFSYGVIDIQANTVQINGRTVGGGSGEI
jgi:hypothetical protein